MHELSERLVPPGHVPTFCTECGDWTHRPRPSRGLPLAARLGAIRVFVGTCSRCVDLAG